MQSSASTSNSLTPRRTRLAGAGLLLASLFALAGCASRGLVAPDLAGEARQYLFRLAIGHGGSQADLRLVMRTEGAARYELRAADLIGRTVWSLGVDGDRFVWSDHRQQHFCRGRAPGALRLPVVRLELPLKVLPDLLLGDYPLASGGPKPAGKGVVTTTDEAGRRLATRLEGGRPLDWTLFDASGHPLAWWQREGPSCRLVVPSEGLSLRWRLISAEHGRPLSALAPPPDFTETNCPDADLS